MSSKSSSNFVGRCFLTPQQLLYGNEQRVRLLRKIDEVSTASLRFETARFYCTISLFRVKPIMFRLAKSIIFATASALLLTQSSYAFVPSSYHGKQTRKLTFIIDCCSTVSQSLSHHYYRNF
jgi:hypothetical protein